MRRKKWLIKNEYTIEMFEVQNKRRGICHIDLMSEKKVAEEKATRKDAGNLEKDPSTEID
jgi:hypothetical protein